MSTKVQLFHSVAIETENTKPQNLSPTKKLGKKSNGRGRTDACGYLTRNAHSETLASGQKGGVPGSDRGFYRSRPFFFLSRRMKKKEIEREKY